MLFPLIEVRDRGMKGRTHIVGTNPHDVLEIQKNGLIGYYNLQNGEGTGGDYSFVGKDDGWGSPTVRFVTFAELQKIYMEQTKKEKESRKALAELTEKIFSEWRKGTT